MTKRKILISSQSFIFLGDSLCHLLVQLILQSLSNISYAILHKSQGSHQKLLHIHQLLTSMLHKIKVLIEIQWCMSTCSTILKWHVNFTYICEHCYLFASCLGSIPYKPSELLQGCIGCLKLTANNLFYPLGRKKNA